MKIKNRSGKQSHKCNGIGVRRFRTFPFSSDSAYDCDVYDLVKTRLSESEHTQTELKDKPISMPVLELCVWFNSSASAYDSDNLVSLDRKRRSRKGSQNAVFTRSLLLITILTMTVASENKP